MSRSGMHSKPCDLELLGYITAVLNLGPRCYRVLIDKDSDPYRCRPDHLRVFKACHTTTLCQYRDPDRKIRKRDIEGTGYYWEAFKKKEEIHQGQDIKGWKQKFRLKPRKPNPKLDSHWVMLEYTLNSQDTINSDQVAVCVIHKTAKISASDTKCQPPARPVESSYDCDLHNLDYTFNFQDTISSDKLAPCVIPKIAKISASNTKCQPPGCPVESSYIFDLPILDKKDLGCFYKDFC